MPRELWLCALAVMLAGCATRDADPAMQSMPAGKYADYRAVLVEAASAAPMASGTPETVKKSFAECSADYILSGIAPLDRMTLDRYARGEVAMPAEELDRIDYVERVLHGDQPLTQGGLERLQPWCAGDIPAFKQAFGQ